MENLQPSEQQRPFWQSVLEYLKDVCYMIACVVLVFSFCIRIVVVSGESMYATLYDGDYLLVMDRTICGELEQGDIVVASMERFRDGAPIVKRVIATAGQTVDINFREGIVYVDGAPLEEPYIYELTHLARGMKFPLTVDEGCLFLMGDNRNDSMDSRDPLIGQVDTREILGRAFFLVIPGTNYGNHPVEFGRIGGLGA